LQPALRLAIVLYSICNITKNKEKPCVFCLLSARL
jgi:hypothetical protein